MKNVILMTVVALNVGSACCVFGEETETSKLANDDWDPFAKPWKRCEKNPILKLENKETYQIQNGPQTVIQWQGKRGTSA